MKKTLLIAFSSIVFMQCTKKEDPFLIQKDNIGVLQKEFTIKQIDSVFANDSIVKHVAGDEFTGNYTDIEVYEKGGAHLLSLSPSESLDKNATINIVTIHDVRYKTDKNVTLKVNTIGISEDAIAVGEEGYPSKNPSKIRCL